MNTSAGPINRSVSGVSTFSQNSNPDVVVQEDGDEVANEKFPWSYGMFIYIHVENINI